MSRTETSAKCNEEDLVEALLSKDSKLFERLLTCFGHRLKAVALRRCKDSDDSDDALQEALTSALEHRESFRGDGSIEGWMVRMVINSCQRMRRGQKNSPSIHHDIAEQEIHSDDRSPEESVIGARLSDVIDEIMDDFSEQDQMLILLTCDGWTAPEIAKTFETTPNAVRVRLSRLRGRIRDKVSRLERSSRAPVR